MKRTDADYEALCRVGSPGATVVFGVVSTRHFEIDDEDAIARKVERAARYLPLEQLAGSAHCGFASALTTGHDDRPHGNLIEEDVQ